jgi:hypothetical protein
MLSIKKILKISYLQNKNRAWCVLHDCRLGRRADCSMVRASPAQAARQ